MDRQLTLDALVGSCFPEQRAFLRDASRRKAAFVARRSGKTWALVVLLIRTCLSDDAVRCLYYGLTVDSAWDTCYLHILKPVCYLFGIPVTVNLTQRTVTFQNESYIRFTGNDADERQVDKALGGKYKLVVFDECQAITRDLEYWIEALLGPAMVDQQGTIVLAGTAGNYMGDRYWYRVTRETDRQVGWQVHSWTPFDNPHMREEVEAELAKRKEEDPGVESEPWYQQQWLCKWVVDTEARIYHYSRERNGVSELPEPKDPRWRYYIGLDFGYEDDTAFVLMADHPHRPQCYVVRSEKHPRMLLDDAGAKLLEWRDRYSPRLIVGDCQNKQLVETIRFRYKLAIYPADKPGKVEHIAAMNSDLRAGKLRVVEPENQALTKEWAELVWDERRRLLGEFKELASRANHLADACLYVHHDTKPFRATPEAPPKPDERDYSWWRKQAEAELRRQLDSPWEPGKNAIDGLGEIM